MKPSRTLFTPFFYSMTTTHHFTARYKPSIKLTSILALKSYFTTSKQFLSYLNQDISSNQSPEKLPNIDQLNTKIEQIANSLIDQKEMRELERIIYPEALLNGQQKIFKLSKLYDILIEHLQDEQKLEPNQVQQLIKAGDFYHKMQVRRLKALKPYLKAKTHIQKHKLYQDPQTEQSYQDLCQKIEKLIEEQIHKGECEQVEAYYKKGLEQEKQSNELQSLYYFYKGICISQYKQIPDKLLHFNLLAQYLFLSDIMRPRCPYMTEAEQYEERLKKYNELELLGNKWLKAQFSALNHTEVDRMAKFQLSLIWLQSNKANLLLRAKRYDQAIKCYEQVINFYQNSPNSDERLQIAKIVDSIEKCYECLQMPSKAVSFLQWAHDFIKNQIQANAILMSRYIKPIDEMLLRLYRQLPSQNQTNCKEIERELKQIAQ